MRPITTAFSPIILLLFVMLMTVDPKSPAKPVTVPSTASPSATAQKSQQAAPKKKTTKVLRTRTYRASYFWDDGSGVNGDTGAPASGKKMAKWSAASPMWPMGTIVRVTRGKRVKTVEVIDMGPGKPAERTTNPIMIDLDTYTFRYLYDGKKPKSRYNAGVSAGHITVKVEVLKWGKGASYKHRSIHWRWKVGR